jgi:hypothetical protein
MSEQFSLLKYVNMNVEEVKKFNDDTKLNKMLHKNFTVMIVFKSKMKNVEC